MNREVLELIIYISLLTILIIMYCVYVIIDEKKKIEYYNSKFTYETDWDKYNTMVYKQRKIIRKKKIELFYYKSLLMIRGLFIWK